MKLPVPAVHLLTGCVLGALLATPVAFARPDLRQISFHPAPLTDTRSSPQLSPVTETGAWGEIPVAATDPSSDLLRYQARVLELEQTEGLYAPALAESHSALADLHLRQGNLQEGLASLERARQIMRVNGGLYSQEQVPTLREMIATNVALGRLADAHALQESLLDLQQRQHGTDTMAFVPALLEWADWNVNLHLDETSSAMHGIDMQMGPGVATLAYRSPALQEAYQRYVTALDILQQHAQADDPRLVNTERKLAALNFMVNRDMERAIARMPFSAAGGTSQANPDRLLERTTTFHFLNGSSALKRAVAYGYVAPEPDYDAIASRLMELGDWYLLFDRRAAALEIYQEALTLLADAAVPEQEVARIVASGMPVQTPDSAYLQQRQPQDYAGYIDVEFSVNKYGMPSDTRVLASSEPDPDIERELLRTIRNCKFRPKFVAGNAVKEESVRLRYYYTL